MDVFHLPNKPKVDIRTFVGGSLTAGQSWQAWQKPVGKTMLHILCVGQGGGAGNGVIGANSTAAGGGGGGSGGQTRVVIPLFLLPDVLYISCGDNTLGLPGVASYVSIRPNTTGNHVAAIAYGGGAGGNGSGATAGSAGGAGPIATAAAMAVGFSFANVLAGQAGVIGGTTVSAGALSLPTTGLLVTGGTGGGGLPAAATAGTNGGSLVVPAAPSPFPPQAGGLGDSTGTTAPQTGNAGFANVVQGLQYNYGGTGGGSTHGSATGGGLVQAAGGNGAPGCGAGGSGGALTGSTSVLVAKGGPGFVIMIAY